MERDDDLPTGHQLRSIQAGGPTSINLLGRHGRNPIAYLVGLPVRIIKLVRLGVGLQHVARQQRDEVHPVIFECDPPIIELSELARTLAAQRREDDAAVQLLRDKAGRHRKHLRLAAARTRALDWITEDRTTNRANELLLAAADSRPVQPITAEQEAWFTRIDSLSDGGNDVAFGRLVALQPRLADVDQSITQAWRELQQENPEGRERRRAQIAVWDQIQQALDLLVGPNADAADPLIRSHRAHELARDVLHDREQMNEPPPAPPGH